DQKCPITIATPRGATTIDHCRTGGAPAHAVRGAAVRGTEFNSGERPATVRDRHHLSLPAAQLRARRGAADRFRLCRRCPADLAPLHGTQHSYVVCSADCRGFTALAHRSVVWVREPAALPVPADALVFLHLYLGAFSLAGVTPRLEPDPDPSGPRRWSRL